MADRDVWTGKSSGSVDSLGNNRKRLRLCMTVRTPMSISEVQDSLVVIKKLFEEEAIISQCILTCHCEIYLFQIFDSVMQ